MLGMLIGLMAASLAGCSKKSSQDTPGAANTGAGAADREAVKARGNAVITAIEKYRAASGRYPDALSDLTPTYMAHIEPPAGPDSHWTYELLHDPPGFVLSYDGRRSGGTMQVYSSQLNMWFRKAE